MCQQLTPRLSFGMIFGVHSLYFGMIVDPLEIQILIQLGASRVCCSGCRVAKGLGRFNGNMPRSSTAPGPENKIFWTTARHCESEIARVRWCRSQYTGNQDFVGRCRFHLQSIFFEPTQIMTFCEKAILLSIVAHALGVFSSPVPSCWAGHGSAWIFTMSEKPHGYRFVRLYDNLRGESSNYRPFSRLGTCNCGRLQWNCWCLSETAWKLRRPGGRREPHCLAKLRREFTEAMWSTWRVGWLQQRKIPDSEREMAWSLPPEAAPSGRSDHQVQWVANRVLPLRWWVLRQYWDKCSLE